MVDKLTTSKVVPTGTKVELTPEMKAKDKILLENYSVSIDQFNLEIMRLEKAIELKLPEREYRAQIQEVKTKIEQFDKIIKMIEERNK